MSCFAVVVEAEKAEKSCKHVSTLSVFVVLLLTIVPGQAIAEEESEWLLMAWDPPADVVQYGTYPPYQERPHVDILAFSMKVNETTFSLRLELNGQVSSDPNVEYSIGVCQIASGFMITGTEARYSGENATFNSTEITFAIESKSIIFQIPKTLMEAEGCLEDGGRVDFEWFTAAVEYDFEHDIFIERYRDVLDFWLHSSFFTDDAISGNIPPIAFIDNINPNPGIVGQNITFVGHGEDLDGVNMSSCQWLSYDEYYERLSSECAFETYAFSYEAGTYEIVLRVSDDKGVWTEVRFLLQVVDSGTDDVEDSSLLGLFTVAAIVIVVLVLAIAVFLLFALRRGKGQS